MEVAVAETWQSSCRFSPYYIVFFFIENLLTNSLAVRTVYKITQYCVCDFYS